MSGGPVKTHRTDSALRNPPLCSGQGRPSDDPLGWLWLGWLSSGAAGNLRVAMVALSTWRPRLTAGLSREPRPTYVRSRKWFGPKTKLLLCGVMILFAPPTSPASRFLLPVSNPRLNVRM